MSNELLERIEEVVRELDAESLGEATISLTHADLFEEACRELGGWDIALAHLLKARLGARAASRGAAPRSAPAFVPRPPAPPREPHPDAMRPLFVITDQGFILRLAAEWLPSSDNGGEPQRPERLDDALGRIVRVVDSGHLSSVLCVADDGMVYGFDARLVPPANEGSDARRMGMRQAVTRWIDIDDRDALRHAGLFVSVTRQGKIKATMNGDFPNPIHAEGTLGFLVDEGDEAFGVAACRRDEPIFLAASNGYAIVFDVAEIRPQGRKATGVRGIGLREDALVCGFVRSGRWPELAMVTAQGYAKRVPTEEFRPQSRAGLGLVAMKLGAGDELTAVTGCETVSDIVVWTDRGRLLRIPNEVLPLMGRPARGDRVLDLAPGERVTGATSLLPA
jgi:DNA gyrase subunit A